MSTVAVNNTDAQLSANTLLLAEIAATITALHTFDRGSSAPFAVASGAAKVSNLDADKLDGVEGSDYARISANNTFTGIQSDAAQPNGSYYNSAVQSVSDNTATALTLDTEDNDVGSMHSIASNTSRVTIVVAGTYLLIGSAGFAVDADGYRKLYFRKNGTTKIGGGVQSNGSATIEFGLQCHCLVVLAANDYVELIAHHTAGNALNVGHGTLRELQASVQVVKLW